MRIIFRNIVYLLLLVIIVTGCNFPGNSQPGGTATAMVQTIIVQMTQTAGATPLAATTQPSPQQTTVAPASQTTIMTITPVPTLKPPATSTPIPCNKAEFVDDVTIKDGTSEDANATFVKTWRLRNAGTCTWGTGYVLVFVSGDNLSAPANVPISGGSVPPGSVVDVSISLKAPTTAGTYQAYFKLKAPDGIVFGVGPKGDANFWVKIVVGVATPTITPTSTPITPTATATPLMADLTYQSSTISITAPLTASITLNIVNQGSASAGHFVVAWRPIETDPATCTGDVASLAAGTTTTVTCSGTYLAPGTYNSKVEIDTGGEVAESNEANNSAIIAIPIPIP